VKNTTIEIDTKWAKIKRLPKKYFLILVAMIIIVILAAIVILSDISCKVKKNGVEFESKSKLIK